MNASHLLVSLDIKPRIKKKRSKQKSGVDKSISGTIKQVKNKVVNTIKSPKTPGNQHCSNIRKYRPKSTGQKILFQK